MSMNHDDYTLFVHLFIYLFIYDLQYCTNRVTLSYRKTPAFISAVIF
jgi:hypothetical protein